MVIVKVFAAGENREERIRKALQAFLLPGKSPPAEKIPGNQFSADDHLPPREKAGKAGSILKVNREKPTPDTSPSRL